MLPSRQKRKAAALAEGPRFTKDTALSQLRSLARGKTKRGAVVSTRCASSPGLIHSRRR